MNISRASVLSRNSWSKGMRTAIGLVSAERRVHGRRGYSLRAPVPSNTTKFAARAYSSSPVSPASPATTLTTTVAPVAQR